MQCLWDTEGGKKWPTLENNIVYLSVKSPLHRRCHEKQIVSSPRPHLGAWREQVHMMADGLLHGAFKDLVGGSNRQEEVVGRWFALREKPVIPAFHWVLRLLLRLDMVEERNGGRWAEAHCWKLLSSSDKAKDVLKGDGAPSNWGHGHHVLKAFFYWNNLQRLTISVQI